MQIARLPLTVLALAALATAALTPERATAEPRYESLFKQGRAEMGARHYREACALFQESLDLGAPVGALLNLADCQDKLGHPARALSLWKEGLGKLDANDERRALAARSIDDLDRRVARVVVVWPAADASARAFVDALPAAIGGDPVTVDPGTHQVTLTDPSGSRTLSVTVAAGELRSVSGEAAKKPGPPALLIGGITAFGVAGLAVVGVGVTGGLWLGDQSTVDARCPTRPCADDVARAAADEAQVVGAANVAMWVVAGVSA
ncbi:MAG: hypothetical protein U0414_31660, partial [Polyangiaceae bacterium]